MSTQNKKTARRLSRLEQENEQLRSDLAAARLALPVLPPADTGEAARIKFWLQQASAYLAEPDEQVEIEALTRDLDAAVLPLVTPDEQEG